jgi:hypothetical protein
MFLVQKSKLGLTKPWFFSRPTGCPVYVQWRFRQRRLGQFWGFPLMEACKSVLEFWGKEKSWLYIPVYFMQGSICVYFFLGNLISEFEFEHVSHDNASFERLNWCIRNTGHGYSVYPLSSKMWSTLVISWFITPSNLTIVITATNPSYCLVIWPNWTLSNGGPTLWNCTPKSPSSVVRRGKIHWQKCHLAQHFLGALVLHRALMLVDKPMQKQVLGGHHHTSGICLGKWNCQQILEHHNPMIYRLTIWVRVQPEICKVVPPKL